MGPGPPRPGGNVTPAFRRRGREQDEARFEALPDQVPPQNLEAEEAVLGGILLDPDALGRIADVLRPEAFYLNAHREIYRTALMLHGQGKPTDLTAMAAWLADTGQLEKVGGSNRLVELVELLELLVEYLLPAELRQEMLVEYQLPAGRCPEEMEGEAGLRW